MIPLPQLRQARARLSPHAALTLPIDHTAGIPPRATSRRGGAVARRSEQPFHLVMAVAALVTVFVGFAPSFYLRPAAMHPLRPLVVAHGVVFSSWVMLYAIQTLLVATGHVRLHRRLGIATAGLAVVMVVLGPVLAFPAARRGALPGDPLAFLLVMLADLFLFGVFVCIAVLLRRWSEIHKRSMILAMVSMLPPAISRWPIAVLHPPVILAVVSGFVATSLAHDLAVRRRVHPMSVWGVLGLVVSVPLRLWASQTAAWHHIAAWLIR